MKIDILVPRDRMDYRDAQISREAMMYHTQKELGASVFAPQLERYATVHDARNNAVNRVRDDADYVLFCDDDMGVDDPLVLVKLITLLQRFDTFGACTPLTVKRKFPIEFASSYLEDYNGNLRARPVTKAHLDNAGEILHPVLGGGGFLLLRASTLSRSLAAHLDARDWVYERTPQLERMGLSRSRIEAERLRISDSRHAAYETNKHHTLFNFPYETNCTFLHGEDWAYTLFLYRMGIRTFLTPGTLVLHFGLFGFSPALLGIEKAQDLIVPEALRGESVPLALKATLEPAAVTE